MEFARPPPEMGSVGPMDENWKKWKKQFMVFLKASGASDWSTDRKASLLINLIGPVGQRISDNFSPEDLENMDTVIGKLDDEFGSEVTEAHERYVFFSSVRPHTEPIEQYINTLKIRAKTCNFGDLMDSLIRDKIIVDMKDKRLRKHLLSEPNLSLNETIDLCKKFSVTEKLAQLCLPKSGCANNDTSYCGRCGTRHDPKHCPARGQKCENCGMLNHFAKSCTKPSASIKN